MQTSVTRCVPFFSGNSHGAMGLSAYILKPTVVSRWLPAGSKVAWIYRSKK